MQTIQSTCIYCGCGCKLNYQVKGKKIVKVLPDSSDEVSKGRPCIKGLTINEVVDKGRNLKPMIRKNKSSKFKKVSWKEAYKFIYKNIKDLAPEEIFFAPSGKITNEDDYVIQKFARIVFKTNNVDGCCSRLCHIATVKGLNDTYGVSSTPWRMDDIYDIDCLLIIGSNPASNYPVIFNRILEAKRKGMKIISIQTIFNLISKHSDFAVTIQPGTETALLNGIINLLIKDKSYDEKVEKLDGFSKLTEIVKKYEPDVVCKLCGIKEEQLIELVAVIKNSKSFGAFHGMGLTQHVNALENVHSLLNLLNLRNGKLLSCRGEINVQGVGDMGCGPDILPIDSFISYDKLEKLWQCEISKEKGKTVFEAFLISPAKAAFISNFNPAQSLPNLTEVHKNLKNIFLICMDPYSNLTSEFANVILPTPILIEKTGTITNGERRLRLVKKVLEPLGSSKPEWLIFKELSKLFKQQDHFNFDSEKQIFEEIVETIPAYSDIDVDSVYKGKDAWADKEIKFYRFNPEEFEGTEDVRSEKYPFILTTFRSQFHYLTGEATSKSKTLKKSKDGAFCYLNAEDAKRLEIKNGNKVRVSSNVSSIVAKAKIDERIPKGIVAMHFHFDNLLVNKLFPTQFDEETFTPNYKMVAVRIEKIASPVEKIVHPEKYVEKIDIEKIVAAPKVYRKGVEKYKEYISAGKPIRPIVVLKHPTDDVYAVLDGHHRFYAFLELGSQTIEVAVIRSNKFLFNKTKNGWLQPTPLMTKYIHIPTIVLGRYVNNFINRPNKLIRSTKSALDKLKSGLVFLRKRKKVRQKK